MVEKARFNLILHRDAIEHLTRITRILSMERGHFLFVGLGGSGKKSLTALGCHLRNTKIKRLNIKKKYTRQDFRTELFDIMRKTAFSLDNVCFLFSEDQALSETYWEDISNVLTQGEIPGFLSKDDIEEISDQILDECKRESGEDTKPYDYFVKKVKENMHIVITMNPFN